MLIGFIFNAKRYSRGQVLAVAMLTAGVVAAALADAAEKGQSMGLGDADAASAQSAGFTILALAMFLSAFQGMYADRLYAAHGRDHWREALFYSHALSIPLFLPTFSQIHSQWTALLDSPSLLAKIGPSLAEELGSSNSTLVAGAPANLASRISAILSAQLVSNPWVTSLLANVPVKVAYLLLNVLTQYICIRGVHLLSARSSSLTVTIVLNIRKLVSLLLSIYLFGNTLAPGVLVGAALVFVGGGLYGFEGARLRKKSSVKKE